MVMLIQKKTIRTRRLGVQSYFSFFSKPIPITVIGKTELNSFFDHI